MTLETRPHIYVEGSSDEYAIAHLLIQHGIFAHVAHGKQLKKNDEHQVQVVVQFLTKQGVSEDSHQTGGRDLLLDGWCVQLRSPKPVAIGLVLDADTITSHGRNVKVTWDEVRERLAREPVQVQAPNSINPEGFLGTHATTRTPLGVWIMPDNKAEGTTEDFLLRLVRDDDKLIEFAKSSAEHAKSKLKAPFSQQDLPLAKLATWLAWQKNPPMSFGTAFKRHVLNHQAEVAQLFVNWVRRLIDAADSISTTPEEQH